MRYLVLIASLGPVAICQDDLSAYLAFLICPYRSAYEDRKPLGCARGHLVGLALLGISNKTTDALVPRLAY